MLNNRDLCYSSSTADQSCVTLIQHITEYEAEYQVHISPARRMSSSHFGHGAWIFAREPVRLASGQSRCTGPYTLSPHHDSSLTAIERPHHSLSARTIDRRNYNVLVLPRTCLMAHYEPSTSIASYIVPLWLTRPQRSWLMTCLTDMTVIDLE